MEVHTRSSSSRDFDEELFDNVEIGDTSSERESVAARLRKRRQQVRQQNLMKTSRGSVDASTSGRRRRRGLENEEAGARGEERDPRVYVAEYEDPYLGWGFESPEKDSWSEDGPRTIANGDAREGVSTDESTDESTVGSPPPDSSEYQDTTNLLDPPDIVILSPEELDRVLPVLPFSEQADFFAGSAAQAVQRWGASLALTVLFSKAALIAATSLTWPLWWPWARAANKNFGVRSKVEYGGIWRTRILDVEKGVRPRPRFGEEEELRNIPRFSAMKTCTIIVGEENGAQTKLCLPFDARYELLQPGQPAEVLVLSDSTSFSDIKAIKDVYLPENGLWLAEYPYIDRAEFLEISLDIEQEAQSAQYDEDGGVGEEGYY
jgi:hypothetical protein